MTLARYFLTVLITVACLVELYLVSKTKGYEGAGFLLSIGELVFYIAAIYTIGWSKKFRVSPSRARLALTVGFTFLCIGDIGWHSIHYLQAFQDQAALVGNLMNSAFIFAYFGVVIALYSYMRPKPGILSLSIPALATALTYAICYDLWLKAHGVATLESAITHLHIVSGTYVFFVCLYFFIASRTLDWTFATAGLAIAFLNGTEVVALSYIGVDANFGLYEFVWGFGVIMASVSMIFRKSVIPINQPQIHSLTTQIRIVSLVSSMIIIGLMTGFGSGPASLVIISAIGMTSGVLISAFFSHFVALRLENFTSQVSEMLDKRLDIDRELPFQVEQFHVELRDAYQRTFKAKFDLLAEQIRRQRSEFSYKIASQVAHDIRSPITALAMVARDAKRMDPKIKDIITGCVASISEIANSLLENHKQMRAKQSAVEPIDIGNALKSLIAEKKLEYGDRKAVILRASLPKTMRNVMVNVNSSELRRVLSNIINNAYQAIPEAGIVSVAAHADEDTIRIKIADTGKGIPTEVLSKVFLQGFSYGKRGGVGMGLAFAKERVESWGGKIWINSAEAAGTNVHIVLKRTTVVDSAQTMNVLVDDNIHVREHWLRTAKENKIRLVAFASPAELLNQLKEIAKDATFFIDHDFKGEDESGLDLAKKLQQEGYGSLYLTTSHDLEQFADNSVILGAIGKYPPWEEGRIANY